MLRRPVREEPPEIGHREHPLREDVVHPGRARDVQVQVDRVVVARAAREERERRATDRGDGELGELRADLDGREFDAHRAGSNSGCRTTMVLVSVATGSPKGDFMGMSLDGSKSFRMMTIDIHTVVEGRIRRIHHLEEWTTAIKQLKG